MQNIKAIPLNKLFYLHFYNDFLRFSYSLLRSDEHGSASTLTDFLYPKLHQLLNFSPIVKIVYLTMALQDWWLFAR